MSGIGHIGEVKTLNYFQKKLGMEIYLPLKDKGIDFIAISNKNYYQIQVKSSMHQKNSYFWFDLYKNKMIYSKNTFYIFYCVTMSRRRFMGKSENFIVIPSLHLEKWIRSKKIATKKGDDNCLNIFVYPDFDSQQWVYRNKGKEINWTRYWNNFSQFS